MKENKINKTTDFKLKQAPLELSYVLTKRVLRNTNPPAILTVPEYAVLEDNLVTVLHVNESN